MSRETSTKRSLHEDFRFENFRNLFDLGKGRFPRQNHTGKAAFFCKSCPVCRTDACLRTQMQNDFRVPCVHTFPQKDILQYDGVHPRVPSRKQVFLKGVQLGILDEGIHGDVDLHAAKMCFRQKRAKLRPVKISCVLTGGKGVQAQIYSVRAAFDRGVRTFRISCRS